MERALTAAIAAAKVKGARLGRIGRPISGYDCVDIDPEELSEKLGLTVVEIDPKEVLSRYREVSAQEVSDATDQTLAGYRCSSAVAGSSGLYRSVRALLALKQVMRKYRLDGGALNCHIPEIRQHDDIGIAPCFGLGALTSQGQPWTCSGDLLTAVAMLTIKHLGLPTLYHELEAFDYDAGEFVIANTGEHDSGMFHDGKSLELVPNRWFMDDPNCGVCLVAHLPPGPATLVGFTPHPGSPGGFRYVAAEGELTGRSLPLTGTSHGTFRFKGSPDRQAWRRWCMAGVNHHSCATTGWRIDALASVGDHLAVETIAI